MTIHAWWKLVSCAKSVELCSRSIVCAAILETCITQRTVIVALCARGFIRTKTRSGFTFRLGTKNSRGWTLTVVWSVELFYFVHLNKTINDDFELQCVQIHTVVQVVSWRVQLQVLFAFQVLSKLKACWEMSCLLPRRLTKPERVEDWSATRTLNTFTIMKSPILSSGGVGKFLDSSAWLNYALITQTESLASRKSTIILHFHPKWMFPTLSSLQISLVLLRTVIDISA